jgi:hypothetical protein
LIKRFKEAGAEPAGDGGGWTQAVEMQRATIASDRVVRFSGRAPLVAIAIPWNGVLWWQLRRLRLAVEVDCDHRVLARGVETSRYGSLLIEVAGRVRKGVLAPAMAASRSTLEHRIVAMTDAAPRHRFLRSALSAVAVVCCLALACDAPSPAELIEPVGERAAWPELRPVLDQAGGARIELDGRPASIEQIRDLAPDAIRSVEVMKQGEEGTGAIERSLIRVTTRAWAVANGLPDRAPTDIRHAGPAHLELPAGAIYEVNGKRIERDAALAIEPSSIERVEVVKRRSLGSGQDDEMSLVRITLRATAGS